MSSSTPQTASIISSGAEKLRFIVVGCINTAVDFIILDSLLLFAGMPIYTANLISTFFAMCVSLVLNKTFVFQQGHRISLREFFTFVGVTLTGLWGIQTLVIYLVTQQFPQPLVTTAQTIHGYGLAQSVSPQFLIDNGAKVIAICVSLVWNYMLYKRVVFGQSKKVTDETA